MNIILLIFGLIFSLLFLLQWKKQEYRPSIILISRVFIALIFIYSGFVKAVDPLGYTYKIIDYFVAFGFPPLENLSFILAIFFSSAEFFLGFGLLIGVFSRLNLFLVSLFMLVFTPLTLFLAISNPVTDCGCFGDALVITNWQTFFKNLIIDIPVLILLINRTILKDKVQLHKAFLIGSIGLFGIISVSIFSYQHLPILDFRPYKIGNNISEGMLIPEGEKSDSYQSTFIYKNTKTKELVEFAEDKLDEPLSDENLWTFVDTKTVLIEKGYHPPIHDFNIVSPEYGDITEQVLNDTNLTFILVSYRLNSTNFNAFIDFEKMANEYPNINFMVLTAALDKDIIKFKDSLTHSLSYDTTLIKIVNSETIYLYEYEDNIVEFTEEELPEDLNNSYIYLGKDIIEEEKEIPKELSYNFFICDPTTLKTVIRANPGLVLLKNGTILNKWHYHDFPSKKDLRKIIEQFK